MSLFFQTLVSTIIGAIFGGSGVTFLTFLIQRHDRKTDKQNLYLTKGSIRELKEELND